MISLACTLGSQAIACMLVDAVTPIAGDVSCSRCKVSPGSLFEREGPNGHSPLQICAQKGLLDVAKKLLDAGLYGVAVSAYARKGGAFVCGHKELYMRPRISVRGPVCPSVRP